VTIAIDAENGTGVGAAAAAAAGISVFYVIPPNQLVPDLLPGVGVFQMGEPVFATGFLVGLLEAPCMAFLRRYHAQPGQIPVGATVAITHRDERDRDPRHEHRHRR